MYGASQNEIGGLVQERRNSIADALDLRLSCTNPSINNHSILVLLSVVVVWFLVEFANIFYTM